MKTEKRELIDPSPNGMLKRYVQIVGRTTTQFKTVENPKITSLEPHMMDSLTRRLIGGRIIQTVGMRTIPWKIYLIHSTRETKYGRSPY